MLIVGAGPTGPTLACDLARRGVGVRIVDRAEGPGTASRAKTVQPRALEVADDLGVVDQVLRAVPAAGRHACRRRRRRVLRAARPHRGLHHRAHHRLPRQPAHPPDAAARTGRVRPGDRARRRLPRPRLRPPDPPLRPAARPALDTADLRPRPPRAVRPPGRPPAHGPGHHRHRGGPLPERSSTPTATRTAATTSARTPPCSSARTATSSP
ncbi:FAD-dependent monooxygenase [Nonomuraea jabiensis]|uniref:FAD-dependent monooxygenase n=1 Tax=Nonomuraea jabiensis TaxID=882448 RepID=UPI00341487F4